MAAIKKGAKKKDARKPSARKRARQTIKINALNSSVKSMVRTAIKKVVKLIDAKDKAGAEAALLEAVPAMDRNADRGYFHKNKIARHKSRLTKAIRALA